MICGFVIGRVAQSGSPDGLRPALAIITVRAQRARRQPENPLNFTGFGIRTRLSPLKMCRCGFTSYAGFTFVVLKTHEQLQRAHAERAHGELNRSSLPQAGFAGSRQIDTHDDASLNVSVFVCNASSSFPNWQPQPIGFKG